jgi:hypothetical protein
MPTKQQWPATTYLGGPGCSGIHFRHSGPRHHLPNQEPALGGASKNPTKPPRVISQPATAATVTQTLYIGLEKTLNLFGRSCDGTYDRN